MRTCFLRLAFAVTALSLTACSSSDPAPTMIIREDPSDSPIQALSAEWLDRFFTGDALFDEVFVDSTGLGPVYIRQRCASCHADDGRGPGTVSKMSVMESDGLTRAVDQSALPLGHTVRPYFVAPATQGIQPPIEPSVHTFTRSPPPVFGRGYLEAIRDDEIERVESEQASGAGGVSGRIHRVTFASEANPDTRFHRHTRAEAGLIGRFGVRARLPTIDDFVADAYQGDMGITSPLRPTEVSNPDALADDRAPGADIDADTVNFVADYVRTLAIPRRTGLTDRGAALFASTGCATCHVPSMRTRDDYPIPQLAGIDAPVYTDLLLHDMGRESTDGQLEGGDSSPTEYRTAPLIGIRTMRTFMHDGFARSLEDAIRAHAHDGSEASASVATYDSLTDAERTELRAFVQAL